MQLSLRSLPFVCAMLIAIALSGGCSTLETRKPLLSREEVDRCLDDPFYLSRGSVEMGNGVEVPFEFDITSRGNGTLRLGQFAMKIYDDHDDGDLYKPTLLTVTKVAKKGQCTRLEIAGHQILLGEVDDSAKANRSIALSFYLDSADTLVFEGDGQGIVRAIH